MTDKISSWHVFLTYGLLCDAKVSYLIDRKIAKRFLFARNTCCMCGFLLVLRGDMQSVPILVGIAWYALFVDGWYAVG